MSLCTAGVTGDEEEGRSSGGGCVFVQEKGVEAILGTVKLKVVEEGL